MSIHPQERHHINSTQARRRLESGHPELWVECPQCHSSRAGRASWAFYGNYPSSAAGALSANPIAECGHSSHARAIR